MGCFSVTKDCSSARLSVSKTPSLSESIIYPSSFILQPLSWLLGLYVLFFTQNMNQMAQEYQNMSLRMNKMLCSPKLITRASLSALRIEILICIFNNTCMTYITSNFYVSQSTIDKIDRDVSMTTWLTHKQRKIFFWINCLWFVIIDGAHINTNV